MLTAVLAAALLLSASVTAVAAPAGVQAIPTAATVKINSNTVAFEAYTIDGYNYFKLRDLAMAFTATSKKFSVEWDGVGNAIRLISDGRYSPVGGELTVTGGTAPVTALSTTAQVYYNGKQISAKAYSIGDYNYFKLRDIGAAMNFSVTYDSTAKSIKMDTLKEYYLPAVAELLPKATYIPGSLVVFDNSLESGYLSVKEETGTTFFTVLAENISDKDMSTLSSVIGIFTGAPDQVTAALTASKSEGQKVLQLDGKTFTCMYSGQKISVTIGW
jgi:hypothetical protein